MNEIPILRTQNSKTYGSGGFYRLVCGGDISHFQDDSGSWQDCDLAVYDSVPAGWDYYFSRNTVRVLLDTAQGRVAIFPYRGDDTKYILFSFGASFSVETISRTIIRCYRNTANARYNFSISDRGIKPYVVLLNSAVSSWQIGFSLSGLQRIGRRIYDGEKFLFYLPNPFFEDAGGLVGEVQESIDQDTATLSWDATGFTYPITVDPQLVIQPSSMDTWIQNGASSNTNFGTQTTIEIGAAGAALFRGLISFDMSSLASLSVVTAATLGLYESGVTGDFAASPQEVSVHELSRTDWVETEATWNIYKTGSNWTSAGGDYGSVYRTALTISDNNINVTRNFDVANLVRYWKENGKVFHSLVKTTNEVAGYLLDFRSNNTIVAAQKPKLTIDYYSIGGWVGALERVW